MRLLSGAEAASGRWLRDSNPTGASTRADGEAAGEETGSKCPPEELLREAESGEMLLADWTERVKIEFERRGGSWFAGGGAEEGGRRRVEEEEGC